MVWLVLVLALLSAASAADQPPNIIFILADDLVRLHFFCFFFSCKNVLGGGAFAAVSETFANFSTFNFSCTMN